MVDQVMGRKRMFYIGSLLGVLVVLLFVWYGAYSLLSFDLLVQHKCDLIQIVHQRPHRSLMIYLCIYILHSLCALPATSLLIIAGGLVFGRIKGMVAAWIGSCIGGTLLYMVARRSIGERFRRSYALHVARFQEKFRTYSFWYLLLLRAIPIMPFFMVNILSGAIMVPFPAFFLTLIGGVLPSVYLYNSIGVQLRSMDASDIILGWEHSYMLLLCGLIITAGYMVYRLCKGTKRHR